MDPRPCLLLKRLRRLVGLSCVVQREGMLDCPDAFLWLRGESGDNKAVPVTLVYDSEVAKRLTMELFLRCLGICTLRRRILGL